MYICCKGRERQRVVLAVQLFSRTTAKALEVTLNDIEESHFFELINNVFDIFNSRIPDGNGIKCGFGKCLRSSKTLVLICELLKKKNHCHFRRDSLCV